MNHLVRAVLGALLLFALNAHAKKPGQDTLLPGQGAVLLTVSVDYPNAGNANAFGHLIPALELERVDGGEPRKVQLQPALAGLQVGRGYGGAMAPGRYRVASLCGSCGDWLEPQAGEDLPEFTVVAGQTSFLGTVMVSAVRTDEKKKPWKLRWAWNAQPDAHIGARLLQGLYPGLAGATTLSLDGWQGTPEAAAKAAEIRLAIKTGTAGLVEPSPHGASGFHFGANNGVIKRWTPGAGLQLIDTGSPFHLRSVVAGSQGQLMAGGEAGTLLYSADDGRTWTDVAGELPYGLVVQVKSVGDDEVVFTLLHGETVSLYRGRLGENRWERLAEQALEFKFWTGLPGMYPDLHVRGRSLALTLPSKKAMYLDLDSGERHGFDLPGSVQAFSFSADGVMRCRCARSIAVNPWESRDLGRTWTASSLDRFMLLPVFRDESVGYTYKGAWLDPKSPRIFTTQDGARTMTKSAHLPPMGGWVATQGYSADGTVMLLTGATMVEKDAVEIVHASTDQGATWVPWPSERTWLHAEHAAVAVPSAVPSEVPSSETSADATAEPSAEPSPESSAEPTPEPAAEPSPEP